MTDRQTGSQVILGIDPGTNIMGYSVLRAEGRSLEIGRASCRERV